MIGAAWKWFDALKAARADPATYDEIAFAAGVSLRTAKRWVSAGVDSGVLVRSAAPQDELNPRPSRRRTLVTVAPAWRGEAR